MHACAHDGHTALGLTLAARMSEVELSGSLRLIFQPAEEGGRGARSMVAGGAVDGVDRLFCLHLGIGLPQGEIAGGCLDFFATAKMVARFRGVPAHAGQAPQDGRNALLGAATALLNIHALPRFGTSDTRVNVGRLEGGVSSNVIAQHAAMAVETRAASTEVNQELERRVRTVIEHAAAMHGLEHEVEVTGGAETFDCDEELVDLVVEEAAEVASIQEARRWYRAGASEDASLLVRRVQEQGGKATYLVVGTTLAAPHHNDHFDIDEESLPVAVELLERIAHRAVRA
jgi:aminobenzoyl-glutamate utilization protein A